MPIDTSTDAIDWSDVAERPRDARGQFVPVKEPEVVVPFLGKLDKRTARAQCYLNRLEAYLCDQGLAAEVSTVAGLCKHAAALDTLLTEYQTDYLANREVDIEKWLGALGHFRRYATALGLRRKAKEINGPSLGALRSGDFD